MIHKQVPLEVFPIHWRKDVLFIKENGFLMDAGNYVIILSYGRRNLN